MKKIKSARKQNTESKYRIGATLVILPFWYAMTLKIYKAMKERASTAVISNQVIGFWGKGVPVANTIIALVIARIKLVQ